MPFCWWLATVMGVSIFLWGVQVISSYLRLGTAMSRPNCWLVSVPSARCSAGSAVTHGVCQSSPCCYCCCKLESVQQLKRDQKVWTTCSASLCIVHDLLCLDSLRGLYECIELCGEWSVVPLVFPPTDLLKSWTLGSGVLRSTGAGG